MNKKQKYYQEHKEEYRLRALAWRQENKTKNNATRAKWRKKNPDKVRAQTLKFNTKNPHRLLKLRYGITKEIYYDILNKQGGTCAICTSTLRLCVDHDHKTKVVRGILCFKHNVSLGHFNDSIGELEKAIKYLRESQ